MLSVAELLLRASTNISSPDTTVHRLHIASRTLTPPAWLVAVVAVACSAPAEQPPPFASLATPPASAGTCVPAPDAGADAAGEMLHAHRLVLTTVEPGGRREMMVYTDAAGRARRYAETIHRVTGPGTSTGENVVAVVAPDGLVSGLLMRMTIAMDASVPHPTDTASHRAWREGASATDAQEALTERQQAQVRALAAWLAQRCPA